MRSNFLQEIIDSTPKEVNKKVRKWADDMRRMARYEARRGSYLRKLAKEKVVNINFAREYDKDCSTLFTEKLRNFKQQEID